MAKQPPKSDEEIAKAALEDLQANLGLPKTLAEYDQCYIIQRTLRATREAKGAAAIALCAGPFANGELVNDLDRAARHAYTRRPSTLVGGNGMNYELPILSPQHAAFCRAEAVRRYEAKLIRDRYGMLVAEDATGVTHTDAVLRALSYYREGKLSLYEIFLNRVQQPYVREAMDKSQRKFEDTPDDRTNVLGAQMELFIHGLFTATCVDWFAEHKKAREADKP